MISKVFILTCDHCDQAFPDMIESWLEGLKHQAKDNGWTISGWQHYCPTCTIEMKQNTKGHANAR